MNKHTPGPWYADKNGRIWRRHPSELYENGGGVAGDRRLATVFEGWVNEGEIGYPVQANARLIAAAPDLLAALQGLLRGIFDGPDEANAAMLIAKARDAVNKATGEKT